MLRMKKRGFIDGISLAVFLVVVISVSGATYIMTQEAKQIDLSKYFVGDTKTAFFYDYVCAENIPQERIILFPNKDIAESYNYSYKECSDG